MNAWMRKELRLLRGPWLVVLALALVLPTTVSLMWPHVHGGFLVGYAVMVFGCLFLSAECFGAEFVHGTATVLLAQPVSRNRLWGRKMLALALVVGPFMLVCLLIMSVLDPEILGGFTGTPTTELVVVVMLWAVLPLVAVGGGLLFSVLTRQASVAFWLTGLTSVLLWVFCDLMIRFSRLLPIRWKADDWELQIGSWWALMMAFGLGAVLLSRRMVLRFQDLALGGGDIRLPGFLRRTRKAEMRKAGGGRAGIRALRRKEWRLQPLSVITAGLLSLLTVLVAVITMQVWESYAGFRVVWLWPALVITWGLVPLLVGAVAVAEERRAGILEWQKTLPVSQSRQWWIKVRTCLCVSFLLGFLLPLVLDVACLGFGGFWSADYLAYFLPARLAIWFCGTLAGLYASSLSRNLMQGLSILAMLGVAVAGLVLVGNLLWGRLTPPPTRLGYFVVGGLLCAAFLWMGLRNFREDHGGSRLARFNGLAMAATLLAGVGLTTLIYQRSWEAFASEDVGPALPAKAGVHSKLVNALGNGVTVAALMPAGSVWANHQGLFPPWRVSSLQPYIWETRCLSATNEWRDVAACTEAVYAIRDDGSLWAWGYRWVWTNSLPKALKIESHSWNAWWPAEIPAWQECSLAPPPAWYIKAMHSQPSEEGSGALPEAGTNPLAPSADTPAKPIPDDSVEYSGMIPVLPEEQPWRVGSETNWTSIAGGDHHVLGLRSDGTLWAWGYGIDGGAGRSGPPASSEPVRWAEGTNWVAIDASMRGRCLALRADGEIRQLLNVESAARSFRIETAPGRSFGTDAQLLGGGFCTGLLADGALWVSPQWYLPDGAETSTVKLEPLGIMSQWRSAGEALNSLWAIRSDGSLLVWRRRDPQFVVDVGKPARRGWRTDWIGLAHVLNSNATYGLTADGKVWVFSDQVYRGRWDGLQRLLLAPSRRPVLVTQFGGGG